MAVSTTKDLLRATGRGVIRAAATMTSPWRSGPDLVIAGVKRGGTTSLFRDLEQHPAMCPLVPSARRLPLRENQKGVHFFDSHFDRGLSWYRSHFPTAMARRVRARRSGSTFTAEASPYYVFHPLAAGRIATALPDALFVIILRDPVERTVSHWSEQTRNGVETLDLSAALDAEIERLGDASMRLATGISATDPAHEHQSYATQSEYADSLRRWFDAVGRDRTIVAFSEDYYRDPSTVIDPITDRLGVARMPRAIVGGHRNAAPRHSSLDADLERRLVERFQADVERVADMLGQRPPWPRFALQARPDIADNHS